MKVLRWLLPSLLLVVFATGLVHYLGDPVPEVPFATARRGSLTSTVITNGQVEPVSGTEIRATVSARVVALLAAQGQELGSGTPLLRLELPGAEAELADARAALAAAEAQLRQAESGGAPLQQRQLAGRLSEARLLRRQVEDDIEKMRRLVRSSAATPADLATEERRLDLARQQVASLEAQIAALDSDAERHQALSAIAAARVRVAAAERHAALSTVSSPVPGLLYEFLPKAGAWLQPGDLIGRVGDLRTVSVLVYVDEPELGRVQPGVPVTVRWDALPDQQWQGQIDRMPTRIQSFGTRQVGEVPCLIDNPKADLLPGANVNAELLTAQIQDTLVIPRQAIRRRMGEEGVWVLETDRLRWRRVKAGITNVTEAQILDGLIEGDRVALLVDRELRDGMVVQPMSSSSATAR